MKPDLNPYQRWQQEKYGNIIPDYGDTPETAEELFENGIEDMNRFAEWMEQMAERDLYETTKEDYQ